MWPNYRDTRSDATSKNDTISGTRGWNIRVFVFLKFIWSWELLWLDCLGTLQDATMQNDPISRTRGWDWCSSCAWNLYGNESCRRDPLDHGLLRMSLGKTVSRDDRWALGIMNTIKWVTNTKHWVSNLVQFTSLLITLSNDDRESASLNWDFVCFRSLLWS